MKQLLVILTWVASSLAGPIPPIELRDQFEQPHTLEFPARKVTILTIADRKGSEQVDEWIAVLKPKYADRASIQGIAQVAGVPSFLRPRIRKRFQENQTYPVMLDWTGDICARLDFKPGVANVLIIARDGAVLGRFSGRASTPLVKEVCDLLERLLSTQAR
jgi:hypothetical protein